jgi:hypothetical protein
MADETIEVRKKKYKRLFIRIYKFSYLKKILYPNGAIYRKVLELRPEQPLESEAENNTKDKSKSKFKIILLQISEHLMIL